MKMSPQADIVVLAEQSIEIPAFERGPLVRILKSVMNAAQSVLPEALYEPLYKLSFGVYKGMLRLAYSRHVAYQAIFGSHTGWLRARLVRRVMPYSLVGSSGLEATYDATLNVVTGGVPGDFVECGVAQGGCAALMASVAKTDPENRRHMWLFDSFQGLPDPTENDFSKSEGKTGEHIRPLPRGSCLGTKDQVDNLLFTKFGLSRESVSLVQGWFQDTLPIYRNRMGAIGVLRIDGDWYESTLCCLENFYDLVSPGGYVIVDDYGSCFGCKKAVHEFLEGNAINARLIPDGRGGVLFSKPM